MLSPRTVSLGTRSGSRLIQALRPLDLCFHEIWDNTMRLSNTLGSSRRSTDRAVPHTSMNYVVLVHKVAAALQAPLPEASLNEEHLWTLAFQRNLVVVVADLSVQD